MNHTFGQFISKAKMTWNQALGHAKETIYSMTGTPSSTVQQIAEFVMTHPESKITVKEYLGVTITFYELHRDAMKYYLEKNSDKVLQLDVHANGHQIVAYRSYRDAGKLDSPVKFPELRQN